MRACDLRVQLVGVNFEERILVNFGWGVDLQKFTIKLSANFIKVETKNFVFTLHVSYSTQQVICYWYDDSQMKTKKEKIGLDQFKPCVKNIVI